MKPHEITDRRPFRASILAVFLFSLLVAGCDSFESDVTDPTVKVSEDELYVLADGETVIDLKSLIASNFAGKLSVTELPQLGTLQPIAEGLLRYAPNKGVKRSRDRFEFTVFNNNSIVTKDTIYINVETDSTNLPCNIYPVADYVNRFDGESVSVPVLRNDILCGKSVSLSVYQPVSGFLPHHGMAEVNGTTVVYTPGASFTGKDTVIYKVTNAQNPASFGYGFVYINRDSVCGFALADDIYTLDTLKRPTTYFLDVFANDVLCDSLDDYSISVVTAPWNGTVARSGRGFTYSLKAQRTTVTDEFTYAVSKGGVQKTARAVIRLTGSQGPCSFQALSDSLDITALSTSIVYIDVLKNDQLCDSLKTFTITRQPKHGNATIDNASKRIRYERVVLKSDSLQYEICNGKVCTRATAYIKQQD
ncbi:Ig-like domain-containing protein [Chryseolinea sp. T2]|uniref:Ig-like domain-containing protein n=1 Tax=Chryseolinea sp. T2 TaxID=3129255 RepID=UPI003076AF96